MRNISYTIIVSVYPVIVIPVISFNTIIPDVRRICSVPVDINEIVMIKSVNSRAFDNGVIIESTSNKVAYK
jgi:hypothetical protein